MSQALGQTYDKGDLVIEAYYGGPNLISSGVRLAYRTLDRDRYDIRVRNLGPLGLKIEYLLSPRMGIGINLNHANTTIRGTYTEYSPQTDTYDSYAVSASIPRYRFLTTFNFHMSTRRVDPYLSAGLGIRNWALTNQAETPLPLFRYRNRISLGTGLAYRIEFGLRYFFLEHLGMHVQMGIGGGPLVAFGISARI